MTLTTTITNFNLQAIRAEFPVLERRVHGNPLVYLDSAATSLKPRCVIEAVTDAMSQFAGNIGRSVHFLAEEANDRYESSRAIVGDFINADPEQIVFTSNATQAINLVASNNPAQRPVLLTATEHHSNLLPWFERQQLLFLNTSSDQSIDLNHLQDRLREVGPALVAVAHVTNSFGARNPIAAISKLVHDYDGLVFVDACQSVAHLDIDVESLDCDFLCFSAHKMCGPTGVGVLYAKSEQLAALRPLMLGGGVVDDVVRQGYTLVKAPHRLEPGTPALEAVAGLSAACAFLENVGKGRIEAHTAYLTTLARKALSEIPGVTVFGPDSAEQRGPIVAFRLADIEAHGLARMLSNRFNICVRSGFHCAQLAHTQLGVGPTVRASFHLYNTAKEVALLADAVRKAAIVAS